MPHSKGTTPGGRTKPNRTCPKEESNQAVPATPIRQLRMDGWMHALHPHNGILAMKQVKL